MGFRSPKAQHRSMTSGNDAPFRDSSLNTGESSAAEEAPAPRAPPPSPMSMAGPPNTTSFAPAGIVLQNMILANISVPTSNHDGLVISPVPALEHREPSARNCENTQSDWDGQPVIVRRTPNGRLQHNVQCRRHSFRSPIVHFPRLNKSGNLQAGYRNPVKPALLPPRPVAPSSGISPPFPVPAPG